MMDVFAMVEPLHMTMVEVGKVFEDTLIFDVAIQWITMRTVVRVHTMVSVMDVVGVFMQVVNSCIFLTIGEDDHQVELQTLFIALGEEEPIGQASGTLKSLEVGIITSLSMFKDFVKTWWVRDGYRGLLGLAGDSIGTSSHW